MNLCSIFSSLNKKMGKFFYANFKPSDFHVSESLCLMERPPPPNFLFLNEACPLDDDDDDGVDNVVTVRSLNFILSLG